MGFASSAVEGKYAKEAAKDAAKLAEQQKKASLQLINEMDFEPMYASSQVPTYQRTQSPVARSYIDSFLMGNNPDAIMSTAPNAAVKKAHAQQAQNAQFGTPQARLAQQNAYRATTPWAVTTPTRPVKSQQADPGAASWTAQNSEFAGGGMNKRLYDTLTNTGTELGTMNEIQGKGGAKNLHEMLKGTTNAQGVSKVLNEPQYGYNGDANRLAADIEAAGGIDKLMAQLKKNKR